MKNMWIKEELLMKIALCQFFFNTFVASHATLFSHFHSSIYNWYFSLSCNCTHLHAKKKCNLSLFFCLLAELEASISQNRQRWNKSKWNVVKWIPLFHYRLHSSIWNIYQRWKNDFDGRLLQSSRFLYFSCFACRTRFTIEWLISCSDENSMLIYIYIIFLERQPQSIILYCIDELLLLFVKLCIGRIPYTFAYEFNYFSFMNLLVVMRNQNEKKNSGFLSMQKNVYSFIDFYIIYSFLFGNFYSCSFISVFCFDFLFPPFYYHYFLLWLLLLPFVHSFLQSVMKKSSQNEQQNVYKR